MSCLSVFRSALCFWDLNTAVTMSGPFSVLCSWANCDVGRRPMDGSRASTYRGGSNEATQASSLFLRRRLDLIPNIFWEAFSPFLPCMGVKLGNNDVGPLFSALEFG